MTMSSFIRPLLSLLLLGSAVLGFAYPALVTGLARLVFPAEAQGSVLVIDRQRVGSALIGQNFFRPELFWGRPSATPGSPYDASSSAGSNLGPTSPALREAVEARVEALRRNDPGNTLPIPVDLVTASASGLDPHISLAAAWYQTPRVARLRGLPEEAVRHLVAAHVEGLSPAGLGEPRVNVLRLNLALMSLEKPSDTR